MRRLTLIYVSVLAIGLVVSGVVAVHILSNADSSKDAFYAATIYGIADVKAEQTATFAFRIFNRASASLTLKNVDVDASEELKVVDICIEGYASRGAPIEGSFTGSIEEDDSLERLDIDGQVVPAGNSVVIAISVSSELPGNYSINHVYIQYSYLFFSYNQTLNSFSSEGILTPFSISLVVL